MHVRGIGELFAKIRWARREGQLLRKFGILLRRTFVQPVRLWWWVFKRYIRLPRADRQLSVKDGLTDHRAEPNHVRSRTDDMRRVCAAYKAAKAAQVHVTGPLVVRGQWSQWWIEDNFKEFARALLAEDFEALGALVENMHRARYSIGVGTSYEEVIKARAFFTRRLYVRTVWCDYRDKLLGSGVAMEDVRAPLIGNPLGLRINGDILTINALRHVYHGREMADWLRGIPNATVVEIGGGCGSQAHQAVRLANGGIGKYVIFDIPEVAAISSLYLLSALPDKRIRLYGEGPVSVKASEAYGLAVFPHFAIGELDDTSVDLYHNACSFSEMDQASSSEYLSIIERTCRRYFSHINHETPFVYLNADGTTSLNRIGSKLVPDPARYKRMFKKRRVFVLPEDDLEGFVSYEYLYERLA